MLISNCRTFDRLWLVSNARCKHAQTRNVIYPDQRIVERFGLTTVTSLPCSSPSISSWWNHQPETSGPQSIRTRTRNPQPDKATPERKHQAKVRQQKHATLSADLGLGIKKISLNVERLPRWRKSKEHHPGIKHMACSLRCSIKKWLLMVVKCNFTSQSSAALGWSIQSVLLVQMT